jgi:hypothetical protein
VGAAVEAAAVESDTVFVALGTAEDAGSASKTTVAENVEA